jgi:hypothetical protein
VQPFVDVDLLIRYRLVTAPQALAGSTTAAI